VLQLGEKMLSDLAHTSFGSLPSFLGHLVRKSAKAGALIVLKYTNLLKSRGVMDI